MVGCDRPVWDYGTLDHETITKPNWIAGRKLTERLSRLTSIAMNGNAEMNDVLRTGLAAISEAANGKGLEGQGEKVDAILDAISEVVADVLPTATAPVLKDATEAVKATLRDLQRATPIDEASVSYIAGRLTATADILGYAAYRTADEGALHIARTQPFGTILDLLAEKAMRNVDLAKVMAKDEAQVSKWLAKLRDAGAVVSHRQGREIFNGLTPIGRLVVEEGWQNERRANLGTVNVLSLEANRYDRYDLARRASPQGVKGAELPRLSATA